VAKRDGPEARESAPLSEELRAVFGRNCRDARIKKGLSQQEVAASTGIAQARIAQIELGKVNVTMETMMRISRVVDHDILHLLRSRDTPAD
jgi:DNA adenine methylase